MRYSIGSIAFGCILRPIVYVINWIHWCLKPSVEKAARKPSVSTKKTPVERFLNNISMIFKATGRNAYIEMSLYGPVCSFIQCAKLADDLTSEKRTKKYLL